MDGWMAGCVYAYTCICVYTGQDGKTRYAIENATRTRIVIADQHIHILGSFANIKVVCMHVCMYVCRYVCM